MAGRECHVGSFLLVIIFLRQPIVRKPRCAEKLRQWLHSCPRRQSDPSETTPSLTNCGVEMCGYGGALLKGNNIYPLGEQTNRVGEAGGKGIRDATARPL